MTYREVILLYFKNDIKHITTVYGQDNESFVSESGGTYPHSDF